MKRWAVSHIDWFEYELTTIIVSENTWQEALNRHAKIKDFNFDLTSLEDAKKQAFDADCMVNCVEIP